MFPYFYLECKTSVKRTWKTFVLKYQQHTKNHPVNSIFFKWLILLYFIQNVPSLSKLSGYILGVLIWKMKPHATFTFLF